MTTRYTILTSVVRVFEGSRSRYVSGVGSDAVMEKVSTGWHIALKGSYEALSVGDEKPTLRAGDRVKITIERAR